jgi:hypothetical protein
VTFFGCSQLIEYSGTGLILFGRRQRSVKRNAVLLTQVVIDVALEILFAGLHV